jgi:DNA-binding response OmpR family regulator
MTRSEQKPYILVIEPDVLLAQTYVEAITQAGFDVRSAPSAQTAIDAIDDRQPDCILLEIQLPSHNGIEFLYELRSYAEWQNVPVVVNTYTSRSRFVQMEAALKTLSVVDVLYKPRAKLADIIRTVRAAIMNDSSQNTEQKSNTTLYEATES